MPDPSGVERPRPIHPTAVVHPTARLDDGVAVEPYAVIGARVVIGAGTTVGAHSVILDDVIIGRGNRIEPHVVIGGRPQDRSYKGEPTRVVIGDDNIFSAFASVDRATGEGLETRIGSGTYIMSFAKVSHNCVIGDGATIVSGVQLGGWVEVGERAYIGGLGAAHQHVRIGRLVIIAGMAGVNKDVPPYLMVVGAPATVRGLNRVGLQRHGIPIEDRQALRRAFRIFYQARLPFDAALAALEAEALPSAHVQHFIEFVREARTRNRAIVSWKGETEAP